MSTVNDFKLPGYSRVWIYQSSRFFRQEELEGLQQKINDFVEGWNTHGTSLSAEIKVLHDLFIVVSVDEMVAKASGCSIDKSVRLIKEIEEEMQISLTGRTTVAYYDEVGKIQLMHFNDLKEKVQKGEISGEFNMFNNLVSSLDDLKNNWNVKIKDSWLMQVPV